MYILGHAPGKTIIQEFSRSLFNQSSIQLKNHGKQVGSCAQFIYLFTGCHGKVFY